MLEYILRKYFNLKGFPFNLDGKLTDEGLKAYNELIELLYKVSELTKVNVNEIIDKLDSIVDEGNI